MKLFYGIQGTGNGHITRARVMAKELYKAGFDVTFLFTGRPVDKLFDMEIFGDFLWREGLTFNTQNGRVNYLKTALKSSPIQFLHDIKSLDLSSYDLVISDFEPVTAWASKKQKKKIIGIGHQYAFNHSVPRAGSDPIAEQVMKYFAPATLGIGLHWHHFNQPILPPIIATPPPPEKTIKNKIIVYLPFENQQSIVELLAPFKAFDFHIYSPEKVTHNHSHIQVNPLSRDGFQKDLYDSSSIISNAGFELASESLYFGKKILVKPLHAQMEQISNAEALRELGYGHTTSDLTRNEIANWLEINEAVRINYPNVAAHIVDWIKQDMPEIDKNLTANIWNDVAVLPVKL